MKKNERRTRKKKKNKGEGKVKVKDVDRFVRLCVVVQSTVTSYLYKRRMDFPYKKRTFLAVQIIKNLTKLGLLTTSGPDVRL